MFAAPDQDYEKRASSFIDEVLWFAEAISVEKAKEPKE
jgi:hypothetical protein